MRQIALQNTKYVVIGDGKTLFISTVSKKKRKIENRAQEEEEEVF